MNKQELIERIKRLDESYLKTEFFLKLIEQLDEQKPVKVPPFVADVIEGAREESPELEDAFKYAWEVATIEFREWFRKLENRNNFARAWLDGYEIEKEKRYTVKIKGKIKENKLVYGWGVERYFFATSYDSSKRGKHTRKELEEAGFGWVFDCEGVEVEEVKDEHTGTN